ncbi:outer membrane protein Imp [Blastochloris viridis]|uniref:LPS-assembly protein LptD n=1 Tax=Blastochloris viridis TaxID=1079 RepID=A0A182D0C0_BLAVI|nr:outer membrane protein Imp [Blastochloris viridis]
MLARALLLGAAAGALALAWTGPVAAQSSGPAFGSSLATPKLQAGKEMLVTADELQYDYQNERVSAVGHVQIYNDGAVLEAERVTYDRRTNLMYGEGNVRLKTKSGDVIYAERLELSQDFKQGFVDSLRLEGADRTHFAAARADRRDGDVLVLRSGVYTACEPCKEDPKKPVAWQVKAARIIHKEGERMVYYENATVEMFGFPVAWFPYFSHPDPTVTRKSGFLMPQFRQTTKIGTAIEMPYFWAIAPDYDLTLTPTMTSKQGLLMQAEWRQRLINGAYTIRAAGIHQEDLSVFVRTDGVSYTPGYREDRGLIESHGEFWLNERWSWGWDAMLLSDRTFLQDYDLNKNDVFGQKETRSQLFLTGQGDRSYFDVRSVYYMGLSESDRQKQLPIVHPVLDYNYTFAPPVFGGELGFNVNLTSLSRTDADFDNINGSSVDCSSLSTDVNRNNCLMRGSPGIYNRLTADLHWKKTLIEPTTGQVLTPFMKVRGDTAWRDATDRAYVAEYISTDNEVVNRGMPAVGVEYRWPFLGVQSWGTQTLEPVAQLVVRPSETQIGKLPNEDAQSLVFDDTNLFAIDKYSGYDRVEGGGRVNAGLRYTAQFNGAGTVNALFGQSYHLFGVNSFAVGDMANTGLDSGLETTKSDYVAGVSYQADKTYAVSSHYRFDDDDFSVRRLEVQASANYERITLGGLYGRYAPQPLLGYTAWREAVVGSTGIKVTDRWSVTAAVRYDIVNDKIDTTNYGIRYLDDCVGLSVNYITDYTESGNAENVHKIMFKIDLRTLGEGGFSTSLGSTTQ